MGLKNRHLFTNLSLVHGVTYYFLVKAVNNAGLETLVASQPVIVDTTPPVEAPIIIDGIISSNNTQYQADLTQISARWPNVVDHERQEGTLSKQNKK